MIILRIPFVSFSAQARVALVAAAVLHLSTGGRNPNDPNSTNNPNKPNKPDNPNNPNQPLKILKKERSQINTSKSLLGVDVVVSK